LIIIGWQKYLWPGAAYTIKKYFLTLQNCHDLDHESRILRVKDFDEQFGILEFCKTGILIALNEINLEFCKTGILIALNGIILFIYF